MQFTKAFSIFALAATAVHAAPEPVPVPQAGANGSVSVTGVADALTTVLSGLVHLSAANSAVLHALIETSLETGETEVGAAAAAISGVLGQSAGFASSLSTILAAIEVCVGGHA